MRPAFKTLLVGCAILGAAVLTLYGIDIWAAVTMSNRGSSVHHHSFDNKRSANFSSLPWTLAAEGDCDVSTRNAAFREPSDVNSTDWRVYRAFASRNVSFPRNVGMLSPSERADVSKEVRLAFHVAERVFKVYHSYIKSFNRCHYRLLSDPEPCSADAAAISVIVVHSLPASTERRMNIRARLLRTRVTGYRLAFLLGRSESMQSEADVRKEAAVYGDIIWADFFEDYDNLTIKTLVMLRWMEQNCLLAHYLVKVDDDVLLNLSNLDAVLTANANQTRIILGLIGKREGVYRGADKKWYMPKYMFGGSTYPPFAHGPIYAISTDLIADLNRAALKINYMHLEDIFIAVCASTLTNIHYVHVPSFISRSCRVFNAVALHGRTCP